MKAKIDNIDNINENFIEKYETTKKKLQVI